MSTQLPPEGTKEWLVALKDTAESILSGASIEYDKVFAIAARDHDDSQWCEVCIIGAMGRSDRQMLIDELSTAGFKDVEVRSEW